jgi:hypothetical protein
LKLRRDAAGRIQAVSAPDRSPAVARAGTALAHLTRLADRPGASPIDVQLVVETSDAAGYARWRSDREAAWRAQGGHYSTASWPAALGPRGVAAVLLPLPFGVAAPSPVVAAPLFTSNTGADGSGAEDVAVRLIAEWLHQAASGPALRLAPPVLATTAGRRVLDLGLRWPLPAGPPLH